MDSTPTDDESVIGDECHIISRQPNGPRYDPNYPEDQLDSHENLVLLCRVHHKMVDDQHETYAVDILSRIKSTHEFQVSQKLSDNPQPGPAKFRRVKENIPDILVPLRSGRDVLCIVERTYAGSFDHEELNSEKEVDAVARFFQEVRDWGDADDEPAERVRVAYKLSNLLIELGSLGLRVFGGRETWILEDGIGGSVNSPVSILHIVRQDSKEIKRIDVDEAAVSE